MKVKQVVEVAREWAEAQGRELPGFRGAHLMGSINWMSPDAEFPSFKDVDMHIIADVSRQMADVSYRGLYLECAIGEPERYATPEVVLADPSIAPNLAVNSMLLDPAGTLADLQHAVARDFAQRRWVVARCNEEKQMAEASFTSASRQTTPQGAWLQIGWTVSFLSGLLATAELLPPTHRRLMVVLGEILRRYRRTDLHDEVLELGGFAPLSRSDVTRCLGDCAAMFDVATVVTKTPVPFQFKRQPFVRPYAIDGSQEMIDEGCFREAMAWIGFFTSVANEAIQADAPEAEKADSRARVDRFLHTIGWADVTDLDARLARTRWVMDEVFALADRIVDQHPDIVDA